MKKFLVIPNSLELLGQVLETNVDGLILPIEHLAVNSSIYFTVEDVKSILNVTSKEVCVSLNKIMHSSDLKLLEEVLVALNKLNISKIFFYDLAVLSLAKRLGIKKELVIFQDHLNANSYSHIFYKKRGVTYSCVTSDITLDEMNEIAKVMPLMVMCYGYLPIFYSRRYLITNYLEYISKEKEEGIYYIRNKDDRYPIVEEEFGTTIYTKEPVCLLNEIENLEIEYGILNANLISNEEFLQKLDEYLQERKNTDQYYNGFLNKKTVYKVEDYE